MIIIGTTIKDVAKYTGLSIATISKYINGGNVLNENKIMIKNAIEKLDFKVNEIARGLKTNRSMTIGILIPNLENIFFTRIVSYIENILMNKGYSTIICDYREDKMLEKDKLEFLINKMVDGIITIPFGVDSKDIKRITGKNIPVVMIDRSIKDAKCDMILVDNFNASYNAVKHLIMNGHKRIAIICGPQNIYTAEERLKGYIRVFEDYNLEIDDSLIKYGDYQLEGGFKLFNELLDIEDPPTALFVTNYEMTLGVMMAINERNIIIPDDLSVVGFDNMQMAKIFKPSISIVMQPMQEIGETAATVMLKRLKDDYNDFPTLLRLKTEFLVKGSVKNKTSQNDVE